MAATACIALVGDFNPKTIAHLAIPTALARAATATHCAIEARWFGTLLLQNRVAEQLSSFGGVWCVPGSPYANMDGALNSIRFARENGRAFLGTCGGFQHALIEFARNVMGASAADHAESNPAATLPLISRLACSLAETTGSIRFVKPSRLAEIYGQDEVREGFNCNFGVNPQFQPLFQNSGLRITATDEGGVARAVELDGHPFYTATLFQPERSALRGETHPLICAFVRAAGGGGAR